MRRAPRRPNSPSVGSRPILPDEAANAAEFRYVRGDQHRSGAQSLGRDHEIVGANWRPGSVKFGAQIAGDLSVLLLKMEDADVAGKKCAQALGVLRPVLAARHAIPQLEQNDRRYANRYGSGCLVP